jgi:hypothetical protein
MCCAVYRLTFRGSLKLTWDLRKLATLAFYLIRPELNEGVRQTKKT